MSELASTTIQSLPLNPAPAGHGGALPTPWLLEVWRYVKAQPLARFGLAWIAIVAFFAVFAPLLANSYPILAKIDGQWQSPLCKHLNPADIIILVLALATAVLCFVRRWGIVTKMLILVGIAVVLTPPMLYFVRPPENEVFEEYREMEKSGRMTWALRAPIPYSVGDRLRDQFDADRPHPWAPDSKHWIGTEMFGADIFSHMIHACRIAMAIGFISTGIASIIGIIIGGLMGYFAGIVDLIGGRLVEIFSAIPTIYLLLTFVAAFPEWRSIYLIMAIIGLTSWTGDARFVRAEFLKLRHQDFVQAAIAAGLPLRSVLFRHILPNAVAPLLVSASFGIAGAILSESTLSFLGLGLLPGEASWGSLLNEAVSAGGKFIWWLAFFPGFAIFMTVLSYNLIGEAFRDALDPRSRERQG